MMGKMLSYSLEDLHLIKRSIKKNQAEQAKQIL